jgi:hypothetical protein
MVQIQKCVIEILQRKKKAWWNSISTPIEGQMSFNLHILALLRAQQGA